MYNVYKSPSMCQQGFFSKMSCYCTGCSAYGVMEQMLTNEKCIIVTAEGRFDLNLCIFRCCECQRHISPLYLVNLVHTGYWPGSMANILYVFSQDVFLKWDILQKRLLGSSEGGFLRSLEDLSFVREREKTRLLWREIYSG